MTPFQLVLREANRWGVKVVRGEFGSALWRTLGDYKTGWSSAPRNQAWLNHEHGEIYWADKADPTCASGLMHEIAHAILERAPRAADEEGSMLAVEHEASRRLRLPWRDWMSSFSAEGEVWHYLSTRARSAVLRAAYDRAEREHLMRDGKPTYRRRS